MSLEPFQEGQALDARDLNEILTELARLNTITGTLPVMVDNDQAGIRIRLDNQASTVYAIVTTAVTGRTSTNLGSGFARIDGDYNFTTGAVTAGTGDPVKFWSRWSGAVAVGDLVELDFRRGQWFLQGKDCGP